MAYNRLKSIMVQQDRTVLLDVRHPSADDVRAQLAKFADLVKCPFPIYTYKITPLSLWNAASRGLTCDEVIHFLRQHSKMTVPVTMLRYIDRIMRRYGLIRLEQHEQDTLRLTIDHLDFVQELCKKKETKNFLDHKLDSHTFVIAQEDRGLLKQAFTQAGYPVVDLVGYQDGESLQITWNVREEGKRLSLRPYQREALHAFLGEGSGTGGDGIVVLPCGAGKTIIGIAAMVKLGKACLILTPNVTSVKQWKSEILDKTSLSPEQVGEYTSEKKQVYPVTLVTYQMLTYRSSKAGTFKHMDLFKQRAWGFIIYDEVHLLPAPVFRATAQIQAARRLGLTATLVREDGREEDVFSLVGPKRYEIAWKTLERQGWIAQVFCEEIRVPLSTSIRSLYVNASKRKQYRIAGENPAKLDAVYNILKKHQSKPALIIGQYLDQLRYIAKQLSAPLITGQMPQHKRDECYQAFKSGKFPVLVVSKVANCAIDLPDATLAIQVSGSFGSRQEEAQRLGRILRPKEGDNRAWFYTIVSANTKEEEFALNRQMFLLAQGYQYRIVTQEERSYG